MDFNAGLVEIYVATLKLTLCVFRFCYGFVETFLTCLQFIALGSFVATNLLNFTTYL